MLLQDKDGVCGAFAVANALIPLRVEFNIAEIKEVAGTTVDKGTSKRGIIRAVEYYDHQAIPYEGRSEEAGWKWLCKWSICCPIIVAIDNRQHWGTVVGRFDTQVILFDPSVPAEKFENNVMVLNRGEFCKRWIWGGRYYAIRIL